MHALSGCDTVSAFHGIGKKTTWAVWCSMPHLGTVLSRLAHAPSQVSPDDLNQIERFVVLLYQQTSTERRGSAVVSTSACHAGGPGSRPGPGTLLGVKTWLSTLEIVYLCVFRMRH